MFLGGAGEGLSFVSLRKGVAPALAQAERVVLEPVRVDADEVLDVVAPADVPVGDGDLVHGAPAESFRRRHLHRRLRVHQFDNHASGGIDRVQHLVERCVPDQEPQRAGRRDRHPERRLVSETAVQVGVEQDVDLKRCGR
jgi:hypothetical protein